MSIFSSVRGGKRLQQHKQQQGRRRLLDRACTEALESRRLLSSTLVTSNFTNTDSANASSDQLFGPFISSNGTYVAFESAATNLTSGGSTFQEVYVRNRLTGVTTLVSRGLDNAPAAGNSWVADMSPDGRYVLFFTAANLTSTNVQSDRASVDNNNVVDLYLRDLQANTTYLVSGRSVPGTTNPTGGQLPPTFVAAGVANDGIRPTLPAYISDDGRFVSFVSAADGLPDQVDETATPKAASDTNGLNDIFVRDRTQNVTLLVTEGATQNQSPTGTAVGTIDSYDMSADGGAIAFSTTAQMVSGDTNNTADVYYRNVLGGATTQASTINSTYFTSNVAISANGQTISFLHSVAAGGTHIDIWTVGSGAGTSSPIAGDGAFGTPALSADGRYVFFRSTQTTLTDQPTSGANVFRYDLQTQVMEVASLGSTGATTALAGNRTAGRLSVSSDGRFVAWQSDGTGVDPTIANYGAAGAQQNLYVRDMTTTQGVLLNASATDPTVAATGDIWQPIISSDGKVVAFISGASNLTAADGNAAIDVFTADVPQVVNAPIKANLSAPNISVGGATSYTFQVTYVGPRPIVISTIDNNDIIVANRDPNDPFSQFDPNYLTFQAKLISINSATNATAVTATYQIVPPGGSWDSSDNNTNPAWDPFLNFFNANWNNTYWVHLNNRQVSDIQGTQLLAQNLGTFNVNIPVTANVGPTTTLSIPENYINLPSSNANGFPIDILRNDNGAAPATIDYTILSGTATFGIDFTILTPSGSDPTGTLTLTQGTPATIYIKPVSDSKIEGDETFTIILSNPTPGATVPFMKYVVTIVDDDSTGSSGSTFGNIVVGPGTGVPTPVTGVAGSSITVDNGTTTVTAPETANTITIPLSQEPNNPFDTTFNYTIYASPTDTAVAGVNFVAATGTISFSANHTTPDSPLIVQLLHDGAVTGDLTFTVVLTNATDGLNIGGASFQVVVKNVDSAVQFSGSPISTNDDAGVIDVPLSRVGNLAASSMVHLNFGGTAVAGQDYVVVDDGTVDSNGFVTFGPNESTKTVHIRLLSRPFSPGSFRDLSIDLDPSSIVTTTTSGDGVTYATVLGTPATESVHIDNVDGTGPQVASFDFSLKKNRISSLTVTFDEDLNAATAQKLNNYTLFVRTRDGKLGRAIKLTAASYDPATRTVTLIPASPLAANQTYQLNVNGTTATAIANTAGNRLDGDRNGTPGGNFLSIFGYGRSLAYADSDNDLVAFSLKGPGNLKLTSLNSGITLDVLDPSPDTSTLLGKVTRRKGGNGTATLSLLTLHGATFDADESKFNGDIRADA